jgi:disulfide oxidoreductase YuzD
VVPLTHYFYKKAIEKHFGEAVRLIYQDFSSPGDYPGAAVIAARIRDGGLTLPVVAVNNEVIAAGSFPTVEELLVRVKAVVAGQSAG